MSASKVQGAQYPFFYNPMWGLFGDQTDGPPGTYYYHSSKANELFWHMLDQVLVRPALIDSVQELRILDRIGEHTLVKGSESCPDREQYSDHLPLEFKLILN